MLSYVTGSVLLAQSQGLILSSTGGELVRGTGLRDVLNHCTNLTAAVIGLAASTAALLLLSASMRLGCSHSRLVLQGIQTSVQGRSRVVSTSVKHVGRLVSWLERCCGTVNYRWLHYLTASRAVELGMLSGLLCARLRIEPCRLSHREVYALLGL